MHPDEACSEVYNRGRRAATTRRKATAAQWAERVQRWQQSGLTAEHFGRREGLDPRQLRWWKWSLGKRAAGGEGASVTSFLPVRVVAAPTAAPIAVEIVLGNGRRVRVLGPVDPDLLAAVLDAAERA